MNQLFEQLQSPQIGKVGLIFGWVLGFIGATSLGIIPIVLSSIASVMAIINYYYQIKKNRK